MRGRFSLLLTSPIEGTNSDHDLDIAPTASGGNTSARSHDRGLGANKGENYRDAALGGSR
jgi:hypothetical protein